MLSNIISSPSRTLVQCHQLHLGDAHKHTAQKLLFDVLFSNSSLHLLSSSFFISVPVRHQNTQNEHFKQILRMRSSVLGLVMHSVHTTSSKQAHKHTASFHAPEQMNNDDLVVSSIRHHRRHIASNGSAAAVITTDDTSFRHGTVDLVISWLSTNFFLIYFLVRFSSYLMCIHTHRWCRILVFTRWL